MSSSTLTINFAFSDSTTKNYSMGPFAANSAAVLQFKNRVKMFNSVDEISQKKFTNLAEVLKSENGAELTGIKSAIITTSQATRIYDAANYGG